MRLLWERERSAGDVQRALGDVTFGAVSQHLRALREARVVSVRAEGRHRYYRARRRELGALAAWLESSWDDALYRLKLCAELERSRRGPAPRQKPRRKSR